MNNGYRKMMIAIRIEERERRDNADEYMHYDDATAYNTEDRELLTDDWAAMNDIFGTHDTVIERYADGMVDGNICNII